MSEPSPSPSPSPGSRRDSSQGDARSLAECSRYATELIERNSQNGGNSEVANTARLIQELIDYHNGNLKLVWTDPVTREPTESDAKKVLHNVITPGTVVSEALLHIAAQSLFAHWSLENPGSSGYSYLGSGPFLLAKQILIGENPDSSAAVDKTERIWTFKTETVTKIRDRLVRYNLIPAKRTGTIFIFVNITGSDGKMLSPRDAHWMLLAVNIEARTSQLGNPWPESSEAPRPSPGESRALELLVEVILPNVPNPNDSSPPISHTSTKNLFAIEVPPALGQRQSPRNELVEDRSCFVFTAIAQLLFPQMPYSANNADLARLNLLLFCLHPPPGAPGTNSLSDKFDTLAFDQLEDSDQEVSDDEDEKDGGANGEPMDPAYLAYDFAFSSLMKANNLFNRYPGSAPPEAPPFANPSTAPASPRSAKAKDAAVPRPTTVSPGTLPAKRSAQADSRTSASVAKRPRTQEQVAGYYDATSDLERLDDHRLYAHAIRILYDLSLAIPGDSSSSALVVPLAQRVFYDPNAVTLTRKLLQRVNEYGSAWNEYVSGLVDLAPEKQKAARSVARMRIVVISGTKVYCLRCCKSMRTSPASTTSIVQHIGAGGCAETSTGLAESVHALVSSSVLQAGPAQASTSQPAKGRPAPSSRLNPAPATPVGQNAVPMNACPGITSSWKNRNGIVLGSRLTKLVRATPREYGGSISRTQALQQIPEHLREKYWLTKDQLEERSRALSAVLLKNAMWRLEKEVCVARSSLCTGYKRTTQEICDQCLNVVTSQNFRAALKQTESWNRPNSLKFSNKTYRKLADSLNH